MKFFNNAKRQTEVTFAGDLLDENEIEDILIKNKKKIFLESKLMTLQAKY